MGTVTSSCPILVFQPDSINNTIRRTTSGFWEDKEWRIRLASTWVGLAVRDPETVSW